MIKLSDTRKILLQIIKKLIWILSLLTISNQSWNQDLRRQDLGNINIILRNLHHSVSINFTVLSIESFSLRGCVNVDSWLPLSTRTSFMQPFMENVVLFRMLMGAENYWDDNPRVRSPHTHAGFLEIILTWKVPQRAKSHLFLFLNSSLAAWNSSNNASFLLIRELPGTKVKVAEPKMKFKWRRDSRLRGGLYSFVTNGANGNTQRQKTWIETNIKHLLELT